MEWKERAAATETQLREQFLLALAGDPAAYDAFLRALASHLRAFFRRRLAGLPDEVEDLVQETLLAIHSQRHTYRAGEPLTAWVHTIARYKLVDLLRRRSRHEALNDPLDEAGDIFALEDAAAADAKRDIHTILGELPERQRRALVMTKLEGASMAEAAQALGMSQVAVKVGLHRTLKALSARWRGQA